MGSETTAPMPSVPLDRRPTRSRERLIRRLGSYDRGAEPCRSIYNQSPIAQYRPAGMPLVTIFGIISFLFFAFLSYTAGANSSIGGPNGLYSLVLAVAAFVGSGAIYFISRAYHLRKSRVDIGMNFREIPPE